MADYADGDFFMDPSLVGAPSPISTIVPSGYGFASKTGGNVLLVFDTK